MTTSRKRLRPIPLPSQYSAEHVRSDSYSGRVYIDGAKCRVETAVAGITTTIAIWRPDLGKSYMIETAAKKYFTTPITPEQEEVISMDMEADVEWEHVGTEELDSHRVDVFDVFGNGETDRRSRVWVDTNTHIRLKEVTFNKLGEQVLTIEAKNVVIGPPPASVFELPPGIREIRIG